MHPYLVRSSGMYDKADQAKSERCIFSAKCRDVGEEHIQIAAGILKICRFSIGYALNLILISRLDSPCPGFCILTVQSE